MRGWRQHLETWLAQAREADPNSNPIPRFVERDLRKYLDCGILAHGFARARCGGCGHEFLIAYSCSSAGTGAFRVQAPETRPTTGPSQLSVSPRRGPLSDRPITARPVRRYIGC